MGAWIAAAANLCLVVGCLLRPRPSALFPIAYDVLLGVAFLYYWPTLLALVSRAAPPQIRATLMGSVFLSLFAGNLIVGWVGGFYEHMTPTAFWALQVGVGVAGAVLASLLTRPLEAFFDRPAA